MIRANRLGERGVAAIARALGPSTFITEMRVDEVSPLGAAAVVALAEAIERGAWHVDESYVPR